MSQQNSPGFDLATRAGTMAGFAAETLRQRRALRYLVWALIPILVWTIAALIMLWPSNVRSHVRQENSQYAVPGILIPKGSITEVTPTSCEGVNGSTTGDKALCGRIKVRLSEGPEEGQTVEVVLTAAVYQSGVEAGQVVRLWRTPVQGQPAAYQYADFDRSVPFALLFLAFVVVVVIVAGWRGLVSLLGLAWAFFILVQFVFPALVTGADPILVGLVGSSAIMFVALYASHGVSARTTTALAGTLFGLALSATLGWVASKWAHLTGVASEDDFVLAASAPDLKLTSVVICGVIIASLGVLNDVTVTQASAVWELAEQDPEDKHLFRRAMRIGRDHIASSVYTMAFVTAGAVMSVLLLLSIYQQPLLRVLQSEQFAGEVIRTLVGAIGLVLSVPVTTAIAVAIVRGNRTPGGDPINPASPTFHPGDQLTDVVRDRLKD